MLNTTLHQIFFESAIDVNVLFGLITIAIGCAGLYISVIFKRPWVFRIKLAIAFLMPILSGLGNLLFAPDEWQLPTNILGISFLMMITILYWREVREYMTTHGYHKKSLGTYIDDIPDLIWVKDIKHRYTYANKAVIDAMNIPLKDILGRTDYDIWLLMKERGLRYDFGGKYAHSDISLDSIHKPKLFLESGYIGNRFIALQICKGPLYNHDFQQIKNHVGYIGIGRDLTYDVEDHQAISKLFEDGKPEEARALFEIHKSRYDHSGPPCLLYSTKDI